MSDIFQRLLRLREAEQHGTIVSIICTAGWHGDPCDEARAQSASRMPCACDCHQTTTRPETP
jgi:hypothetical protein